MMIYQPLVKTLAKIQTWSETSKQHQEINRLSQHLLDDIGLARVDSGYASRYSLWNLKIKRDPQDQQQKHPEKGSQVKICAFGKCFQI